MKDLRLVGALCLLFTGCADPDDAACAEFCNTCLDKGLQNTYRGPSDCEENCVSNLQGNPCAGTWRAYQRCLIRNADEELGCPFVTGDPNQPIFTECAEEFRQVESCYSDAGFPR